METPLTALFDHVGDYLVPTMTLIPIVLIIVGLILRGAPFVRDWLIPFILWFIGIAVGVIYDTAPQLKLNVANGIVQGSIATGVALLYWKGLQNLIEVNKEKPPDERS
jgi:hypothetical protein